MGFKHDPPKPRPKSPLEPAFGFAETSAVAPDAGTRPHLPFARITPPAEPALQESATRAPWQGGTVVQLLWLDPAIGSRLRMRQDWRVAIDAIEMAPEADIDPALVAMAGPAARDAFEVVAATTPTELGELSSSVRAAVDHGRLTPPLLLLRGRLKLPFDAHKQLQLARQLVEPLCANDETLRRYLAGIAPWITRPDGLVGSVQGLTSQLFSAVQSQVTTLPKGHLERALQRMLLEQRAFVRRHLFGDDHVVGQLAGADGTAVTVYVTEAGAQRLPLFDEIDLRLLAEVHPPVDAFETDRWVLLARCLAREIGLA
jgi:hypothetical protein